MDIPEIIGAMRESEKQLKSWLWIVHHCDMVSGVCMCGDSMENHAGPMSAGHEPVDMGIYSQGKLIVSTEANLLKLRAAIAALGEMQWHPIETAPDGHILLYNKGTVGVGYRVGFYFSWTGGNPTHWMPLPAAPKPTGEE